MKLAQSVKMAFSSILSNKMRSFLTMLGIIIGVMAVTLLISLVQGATGTITESLSSLGGNKLTVTITAPNTMLTLKEAESMADKESISEISVYISGKGTAKAQGNWTEVSITGITTTYQNTEGIEVISGRKIQDIDNEYRLDVCLIGHQAAMELFGNTKVTGNTIRLSGKDYRIIGVLKEEGSNTMNGRDHTILLPYTNAQRLLKSTGVKNFYAYASSEENIDPAENKLDKFLLMKCKTSDNYNIFNMSTIQENIDTVLNTMSLMLAGIAGISLLVGGIGIMNIMLVSVTERTKEIGIRKAIGAQKSDIIIQFLQESVALSTIGGIIGMILSWIILNILELIFTDYTFSISPAVGAVAIGFSILVGIVFGIYPANKAAKLKPIDALRFE